MDDSNEPDANADLIVTAVNEYDALKTRVAELEQALVKITKRLHDLDCGVNAVIETVCDCHVAIARAALTQAEKE
jgi:hypothetical protein